MAFKKISDLSAASNLLSDDLFMIASRGKSYKLTYSQLSTDLKRQISVKKHILSSYTFIDNVENFIVADKLPPYEGLSSVTVNLSLGIKNITENGIYMAISDDFKGYSEVSVNVMPEHPSLTSHTFVENVENYDVSAMTGYEGLSSITVDAPLAAYDAFNTLAGFKVDFHNQLTWKCPFSCRLIFAFDAKYVHLAIDEEHSYDLSTDLYSKFVLRYENCDVGTLSDSQIVIKDQNKYSYINIPSNCTLNIQFPEESTDQHSIFILPKMDASILYTEVFNLQEDIQAKETWQRFYRSTSYSLNDECTFKINAASTTQPENGITRFKNTSDDKLIKLTWTKREIEYLHEESETDELEHKNNDYGNVVLFPGEENNSQVNYTSIFPAFSSSSSWILIKSPLKLTYSEFTIGTINHD